MSKQKRKHWNSVESRLHFAKPYVDGFENWLQDHGYTPSTIEEKVRLLAGWTDWMHAAGFALDNVLDGLTASAAVFKGKKSIRAYAGAGCATNGVSPTRRSTHTNRPWSIFSKRSATIRRPLLLMQSGPLSLNGPSRTAAGAPKSIAAATRA